MVVSKKDGGKTMKLTKEQAVAYFNEKAPKALKEKGIQTIEGYSIEVRGEEERIKVFIINGCYVIRYIIPQPMNCLMRNQHFKPVVKGFRMSKSECADMVAYWKKWCYGIVEEDQ